MNKLDGNNKKNIIVYSVIVAVSIVLSTIFGVFIGKGIAQKNIEIQTTTTTTTTQADTTSLTENTTAESITESTTEVPTTEKDKDSVSVTVVDGIISNTDRNNFSDMLGHILWHNIYFEPELPEGEYSTTDYFLLSFEDYDYKSEKAKRFAYKQIFASYYTLLEEVADIYNWDSRFDYEFEWVYTDEEHIHSDEPAGPPDPKGLFNEFGAYWRISAKYVDICFETVFNITPDHDYIFKSKDGEVVAYYYDGYYYAYDFDGGDVSGPDVEINDIEIMNDGKFLIKATFYNWNPNSKTKVYDVNVVAEMKEVDGQSIWSFYKITKV